MSPPAANAIDCLDVELRLGARTVLSHACLAVTDREFIGVLGPNGAGKTTLMRAILGLMPASHGDLRVFGLPPGRGNPAIGYMPQIRSLPVADRLSGRDFVACVVRGHRPGLPRLDAAGRREVDWALDMVGAVSLAERRLADLSGGERQRLLLAQALVGRPRLLLLDEPLISLDPRHQRGVVELVRALQVELQITVLFSAHELNPLLGSMDRVLYLGGGHAALGTVAEVITGPVLSRLYGSEIEVVNLDGRIFVMAGQHDMESGEHRHNQADHEDHGGHHRHA